jgi:very-short-patch-repair endonuclease
METSLPAFLNQSHQFNYCSALQWIRRVALCGARRRAAGRARAFGAARARDPQRRTRRQGAPRAAEGPAAASSRSCYCFPGCVHAYTASVATGAYCGSGSLLVRVMREGARAAPAPDQSVATRRGAVTPPAPCGGMIRTNKKPSFQRAAVLAERAWAMRASPTPTEQLLWAHIRGRRLGVVFRRQVPLLGLFIADFLAPAQRLVIEVDGAYHGEHARADARRDAALERSGYRVLRIAAALVASDIESAIAGIRARQRDGARCSFSHLPCCVISIER